MIKRFWLFRAGEHFELRETIAGSPRRAKDSRGVRDKARGPNAVKILTRSLLEVTKQISDGISIKFRPHPALAEARSDFYRPLTLLQQQQARSILNVEGEKSPTTGAKSLRCIRGGPCEPSKKPPRFCDGCGG